MSLQVEKLSALSARVGVKLIPEKVALPGLRFTTAFILSYDGSPLGEIAYVDDTGAPVVFEQKRGRWVFRMFEVGSPCPKIGETIQ